MISDPRESVRWPVRLRESTGASIEGEIQDISPGGVFVRFAGPDWQPTVGEEVELTFAGGGVGPVVARATIRWVGYNRSHGCLGFGAQFNESSSEVNTFICGRRGRPRGVPGRFLPS